MPGTLFVVATPIGNLEDVSARALRILREVSVIAAEDTRRTAHLLARYGIPTPTTSLHEHNEHVKSSALVARLQRGEHVALVSDAGMPTVSDPGRHLIRCAIDAGIRIEPIPGASAPVAALAVSGFDADTFTFLGFPPTRSKDRKQWFEEVRAARRTVIFFEAPHRIRRTLEDLKAAVGDTSVVLARELTKTHEELVRGPISELLKGLDTARGEYTVVVDIGRLTNSGTTAAPDATAMLAEFGEMTETGRTSRRAAIGVLAKRHRLAPNLVYQMLEQARKSIT